MELGEKLRQARLEAGMSQRALCGEYVTRNMLSQIENGAARPSMRTLQYLASRLGKPVSYFLEEGISQSPNQLKILSARRRFDDGDWQGVLEELEAYQVPDQVFDRERDLMWSLSCLALAEEAIKDHREPYARDLLDHSRIPTAYCSDAIRRQYLLLLGSLREETVAHLLPSLDEELLLRAREALEEGVLDRAGSLLEAAEARDSRWHLLRGQVFFHQEEYREAAGHLLLAEKDYPKETVPQLEIAFRELGDYQKAYLYACKARG